MSNIGTQIAKYRIQAGLTREQLANMSGVDKRTVYAIECGQKNGGHYETIRLLLKAMGYELCAVKFREEEKQP